jgi:hypothetical protein
MASLKNIPTLKYRKFLARINCKCNRKKGGHEHWSRKDLTRPLTIQASKKTIPEFIILQHLRHLNMSREEFITIMEDL